MVQYNGFEPLTSVESGQHSTAELKLQLITSNHTIYHGARDDTDHVGNNNRHTSIYRDTNLCDRSKVCSVDYMGTFEASLVNG